MKYNIGDIVVTVYNNEKCKITSFGRHGYEFKIINPHSISVANTMERMQFEDIEIRHLIKRKNNTFKKYR